MAIGKPFSWCGVGALRECAAGVLIMQRFNTLSQSCRDINQGFSFVEVAQDVRRASEPRALRVFEHGVER
ncbi:MAG: hypothetical protein KDB05_20055, partial [Planctomycetales bacterium]|nr:hypothetical protein [Planctomycetales bacterium]